MKTSNLLGSPLVALSLLCGVASACGAVDDRPNILYCLADDWGWPHAGAYGDRVVKTPTFDRLAREGVLFTHCFSAAPSCTPSRAAMLTGQYPHRLEQGGVLWGFLPRKYPVYPDLLEKSGYVVGSMRKGWGPGRFEEGGYARNPAGPSFRNLEAFLKTVPRGKPFCFWFGSNDPHRPYEKDSGARAGLKAENVVLPPYWPDNKTTRNDMLDYYLEVERFDREAGEAMELLDKAGLLENTIVIMTGDNGVPFPRCKANLYDGGTRQPLAVRWPGKVKAGQVRHEFINLMDLAPTLFEAAGLRPPPEMTGRSFLPLLTGQGDYRSAEAVFLERERHANVRAGDVGYPMRAIRTPAFLYIRNFQPDRWPAGDPQAHKDPMREFGDCDDGPTKDFILQHKGEPAVQPLFELCFGKRLAEELYDLESDPHQTRNVASVPAYAAKKDALRARLEAWMKETADPRAVKADDDRWDKYPYFGGQPARTGKSKGK
ncbi:MAG TPA: sulfatase [Verrucomicrobiae bacterium]